MNVSKERIKISKIVRVIQKNVFQIKVLNKSGRCHNLVNGESPGGILSG